MVAAVLLPNAKAAFITSAGLPAVGYKLKTYDAGTLVPRPTYLDAAGGASNTNPIILDARGEAVIYWDGSYKVILTDPNDVVIWTVDNFSQGAPVSWVTAGGAVDAITATYSPSISALTDGLLLGFRAGGANTSAAPTFSPNGLTAHTIVKMGGLALVAGDIPRANYEVLLRYNLANTRWEMIDPVTSVLPGFHAYLSAATANNVTGDNTFYTVIFNTENFDSTSTYNNATGQFTCTVPGLHLFTAQVEVTNLGAAHVAGAIQFSINAGSAQYRSQLSNPFAGSVGANYGFVHSLLIQLSVGQTVEVRVSVGNVGKTVGVNGGIAPWVTSFSGCRMSSS